MSKPGFDFSRIRTVVLDEPVQPEQRSVIDEFARQLIRRGYTVRVGRRDRLSPGDALLEVNVTRFAPDRKYLVQLNRDDKGQARDVLLVNPVTEISGRSLYPSSSVSGLEDAQVLISNATVSVSARLLDPSTQDILWSGAATYEGLDLDAAVEGSVASLMKQFPSS